MKKKSATLVVAILAAHLAGAAPGEPLGPEFLVVAGELTDDQSTVAVNPFGNRLVAWVGQDASGLAVLARYDAHSCGSKPLIVAVSSAPLLNAHARPDAAIAGGDGAFVVAWQQTAAETERINILLRRFDLCGQPVGDEIRVNSQVDRSHGNPAVAMDPQGGFIVVWDAHAPDQSGTELRAQRFTSAGAPSGDELVIDTLESGHASGQADVGVDAFGKTIVVWTDGQIQTAVLAPEGPLTQQVNEGPGYLLSEPVVAATANGEFVVAWQEYTPVTAYYDVMARRFGADAVPLGGEFRVNTVTDSHRIDIDGDQLAIAASALGDFTVVWGCPPANGVSCGVYARRYDAGGTPLDGELRVDTRTEQNALDPSVGMDADGDFTIAWTSRSMDGADADVYARRFRGMEPVDLAVGAGHWPPTVAQGGTFQYLVTVMNTHGGDAADPIGAATGVTASLWLSGAEFISPPPECSGREPMVCDLGGSIANGHQRALYLSARAPSAPGTATLRVTAAGDQDDPDAANNFVEHVTGIYSTRDIVPDPFVFDDRTGVARNTEQISNTVTITGINEAASISLNGAGQYSIDDGPFTSASGTIENGQTLRVRHVSSAEFSGWVETSVYIGDSFEGYSEAFGTQALARDTLPDAFVLEDRTDVARDTEQVSNAVTITGLNDAVSIFLSGAGEYSIDDGAFTTAPGTVQNGQTVRVRHTSSAEFSGWVETYLFVGESGYGQEGYWETFSTQTVARDALPDAFVFEDRTGVARNSEQLSNAVTISGLNDAVGIFLNGPGEYSIDDGPFTTAPGTVQNGQTVRVRHASSAEFSGWVETYLFVGDPNVPYPDVGGYWETFSSQTLARDWIPDPFVLEDRLGVPRATLQVSDAVTVTGINDATPVIVSGAGEYSIDEGPFTAAAGWIQNGQTVRVRHLSSPEFSATVETHLLVGDGGAGGYSETFSTTTFAQDTTPDPFTFADASGVTTGASVTSGPVSVAGINSPVTIDVAGGEYSINGDAFTTASGEVGAGDQIHVRHTAAATANTAVDTTLTVGGVSDTFTSVTGAADTTPTPFSFADVTGVRRNARTTSNTLTVSGINAVVAISVAGGDAQYSKNGGAWTSAAGTVVSGNTVRLRVTSAATTDTTVNVGVTIGGVSDTWSVTTGTK